MPSNKNIVSLGSKNWISKYFELVKNGHIVLSLSEGNDDIEDLLELVSSKTGLIFGVANSFIFSDELESSHYTNDESLKLLLFESLLLVYLQRVKGNFNKKYFIQSLCQFYKIWQNEKWINKWIKGDQIHELEKTLSNRIKVNSSIFGTNYWINHLSNALTFIDVLLFIEFLDEKTLYFDEKRDSYSYSVLKGTVAAALADGLIEPKERKLIDHLLASANLPAKYQRELKGFMNNSILPNITFENIFLAKITFKLSIFLTSGTHKTSHSENEKISELGTQFGLNNVEIEECRLICDAFIDDQNIQLNQIIEDNHASIAYKGFSKRWIRILGRNREKFVHELNDSKELISLIKKSTSQELTKDEKEKVRAQFMDILKSVPSIGIFLLPGGAILLPLILKIVPDLLPSAFKENEIEQNEM